MIKKTVIVISVLLVIFTQTSPRVWADTGTSQALTFRSGGPVNPVCYPVSLNENLQATKHGESGPGCSFTVDTRPSGEWSTTGGYFNTPPYGFGADSYQDIGIGADFSFTCEKPTYRLDTGTLPSYVLLTKEEDIPPQAFFPIESEGKRYHFAVSASAPPNQSFNIGLAFQTNCQMKRKSRTSAATVDILTPVSSVSEQYGSCNNLPPIALNPRRASFLLPLTTTGSCRGTEQLTPSPAPLQPTVTPKNHSLCSVCSSTDQECLSTCQQETMCQCDSVDILNGSLTKGSPVTFVSSIKVNPATSSDLDTQISSLRFRLEQNIDGNWNLVEAGLSPVEYFSGPTIDPGVITRRYVATWTTTIPEEGVGTVSYRVRVAAADLVCQYKSIVPTASTTPQLSTSPTSVLDRLTRLLGGILGLAEPTPTPPGVNTIPIPSGAKPRSTPSARGIQLGTLEGDPNAPGPQIRKDCKLLEFDVVF